MTNEQQTSEIEQNGGLIEYLLILALVAVVVIVMLGLVGPAISDAIAKAACLEQTVVITSREAVSNCSFTLSFPDGSFIVSSQHGTNEFRVYLLGRSPNSISYTGVYERKLIATQ